LKRLQTKCKEVSNNSSQDKLLLKLENIAIKNFKSVSRKELVSRVNPGLLLIQPEKKISIAFIKVDLFDAVNCE